MKYIKVFNSQTNYDDFISEEKHISPIVSFCMDNENVHFCKNSRVLNINCPNTNLDVSKYRVDYQKEYNQNIYGNPGYYINDLNVSIGDENVTSTVWNGNTVHINQVYDHITINCSTNSTIINDTFTKRASGKGLTILNENALIENIKGNSIYWNQYVQNGNFINTNNWIIGDDTTITVENNIATIVSTTANRGGVYQTINNIVTGHKYLLCGNFTGNVADTYNRYASIFMNKSANCATTNAQDGTILNANDTSLNIKRSVIFTGDASYNKLVLKVRVGTSEENPTEIQMANIMLFDLTKMFGEGYEPTTAEQFFTLFPLNYYNTQVGQYLHFNTTLRSVLQPNILTWANIVENKTFAYSQYSVIIRFNKGSYTIMGTGTNTGTLTFSSWNFPIIIGHKYLGIGDNFLIWYLRKTNNSYTNLSSNDLINGIFYTTENGDDRFTLGITINNGTTYNNTGHINIFDLTEMFGEGNEPTTTEEFNNYLALLNNPTTTEEFESANYQDLPFNINTIKYNNTLLFPDGLKSVGDTYDELYKDPLDNTWKAIKRIDSNNIELEFEELYILNDLNLNNVIKVRTNGIEQIYPINSSVPYTAPMNLDIRYGAEPIN